ncbi:MAG TPA: CpsD/CapB family tyrosine-protein kinase, partial [Blastocatellia bacterium]
MGTVYEALKKSEQEQQQAALNGLRVDGLGAGAAAAKQDENEFDFVDYSLNAPSATEIERVQQEIAASSLTRRSEVKPAREINLDVTRIDPHLVTFYDFDPRASDQYNQMATALISAASERRLRRVLIASAQPGEGRTCVTLNLACALASAKQRVLVVDTDLRKPSVMRLLGLEAEVGIAEALAQELPAGAAAVKVQPYGFAVLPVRERVEHPAQLLASPSFRQMLGDFEPDYDFMLFDSSPLLSTGDSTLLTRLTDATLMVI